MAIPSEVAWLVPIVAPLLVGLLLGAMIRRTVKLILLGVGLIAVLAATGYVSLTFKDIYNRAMELLPKLIETGEGLKDVLPYSSAAS